MSFYAIPGAQGFLWKMSWVYAAPAYVMGVWFALRSESKMRKRVYLYVVRQSDILVLRHIDFPSLGLQIPGGTVETGEAPIDAAVREVSEETGLARLESPRLLGTAVVQSNRAYENKLEAWFYRIEASEPVPESWLHIELPASESDSEVRFGLSWIMQSEAIKLLDATDCLMLDAI